MRSLRESRLRHATVLAPLLLIELALALYFFHSDLLGFALPLFLPGALSTLASYAVILRCWRIGSSAWSQLALTLACAFAAFQVSLLLFWIISASEAEANPLLFLLVVLVGANVFFFPAWLLLGGLAYLLVRLTSPKAPPAVRPAVRRPERFNR